MEWIKSDTAENLFCFFGVLFCVIVLTGILVALAIYGKEVVEDLRWKHQYKHRFDKPPTAKCYCKDCKWHIDKGSTKNRCTNVTWADRYTPDNGFCYDADPKARDGDVL